MADPMKLHPLCTLFPRMEGAEFEALKKDIATNGLRSPIVTHGGMVLDGGNRERACAEAGVEPTYVEFDGDSIVSFVLSANLHRRHMTAGQQAAIVSSATDWGHTHQRGGDRKSGQREVVDFDSVERRAAVSGVSRVTQMQADKLAREHPKVAKQVAQGKKSLYKALKETKPAVKSAKQVEAEQAADDANSDFDAVAELEKANKELDTLHAQVAAAEADDTKGEALKWRRAHQVAEKRQSELMDAQASAQKHAKFLANQLARCGRAVGETDQDKIAPTVEAFVRRHTKAAA